MILVLSEIITKGFKIELILFYRRDVNVDRSPAVNPSLSLPLLCVLGCTPRDSRIGIYSIKTSFLKCKAGIKMQLQYPPNTALIY